MEQDDAAYVQKNEQKNQPAPKAAAEAEEEFGGPSGPEPTRYGDWERGGKCVDF